MNGRLAAVAAPQYNVFTRAQALRCGYDDDQLKAMVRRRVWRRIRRGAYTDSAWYDTLDDVGRHRVLAHAVTLSMGRNVVVSHASAAVLHGFSSWGLDLSRLHVTRADAGAGRVEFDVHHHVAEIPDADLTEVDGLRLVVPVRAVYEATLSTTMDVGLVLADDALHGGHVSAEELRALAETNKEWPGSRTACQVAMFADGRSESAGESLLRLLMYEQGLPRPELQYDVRQGRRIVGRVDFCYPEERVAVEFDGKIKYGGFDDSPARAVFKEKRREDRIREAGFDVIRVVWDELEQKFATAARIRQALDRGRARNVG